MYIDPLGIPFMQRALGQGEVSKRDLQQVMMGQGAMGSGMAAARGGMGAQQPMQFNIPQMGSVGGPADTRGSGNGPNPYLMDALFGRSATLDASGNWTPGRQGFPDYSGSSGGGGPPAMTALRGMGSK